MPAARRTKKAKPAEEIQEVEEVDTDLELDEDEAEEEAPAPKAKKKSTKAKAEKVEKPAKAEIAFGTQQLADHVNEEAGTSHTPYTLRILLRKLTADGVLERAESEGRARYSFTGPEDPQVQAIVEAVKSGADKKAEAERLQGLKDKRAAKKAAEKPAKGKRTKKADVEPEPEEEDDFDAEIEDI
jgi:hypothetical protein